jgi:hypothetical protein
MRAPLPLPRALAKRPIEAVEPGDEVGTRVSACLRTASDDEAESEMSADDSEAEQAAEATQDKWVKDTEEEQNSTKYRIVFGTSQLPGV